MKLIWQTNKCRIVWTVGSFVGLAIYVGGTR